mmetsp:Transcript_55400/g.154341  ORF Transcript_55400/g.154341 Transcript_55400/m.154341 type:complete len:206 (-) Transcript_55400:1109-1726(-)
MPPSEISSSSISRASLRSFKAFISNIFSSNISSSFCKSSLASPSSSCICLALRRCNASSVLSRRTSSSNLRISSKYFLINGVESFRASESVDKRDISPQSVRIPEQSPSTGTSAPAQRPLASAAANGSWNARPLMPNSWIPARPVSPSMAPGASPRTNFAAWRASLTAVHACCRARQAAPPCAEHIVCKLLQMASWTHAKDRRSA